MHVFFLFINIFFIMVNNLFKLNSNKLHFVQQLDLQLQDETGGDISSYVLNGEWELLGE